jgi:ribonuclease HII
MKTGKNEKLPEKMLLYEKDLWAEGFSYVAGIDEAGRGPLAGPVVVAAVIFSPGSDIPPVDDSKKLSEKDRAELKEMIISTPGILYSIQVIAPETIDEINILQATHKGMRAAASSIPQTQFALIDGLQVPAFPVPSRNIIKGDSKSATIAAASILAKTHRDAIMRKYAEQFPQYGFERNSGYGTAEHLSALKKYGITPIHRKSFKPVREILFPPPEQLELF